MSRWDDLGDLRQLLDPEALTSLLRDGSLPATAAAPDHLRLKVGVNALVGMRIEAAGGHLPGYVRTYADPAQASRVADKWRSRRVDATALGPGVRLLPGGSSVLFLFPNDARVRRLRPLLGRPRRLARLLRDAALGGHHTNLGGASFETLRYKPERRIVAAAHLTVDHEPRSVVFRLRSDDAGSDLSRTAFQLHEALGDRVPRPLGAALGGVLVVEEHVPGVGLAAAVRAGDADAATLADVIAELHTSRITLPTRTDTDEILSRALAALALLVDVDPSLGASVSSLQSSLVAARPPSESSVPLHGDLHLDQVILTQAGPVVLDFERAVMGPAEHDLGSLVAHLRADGEDAFSATFLDAYARARAVDTGGLAFYIACGHVQRALLAFRSLRPDWREAVPHLIDLAHEELHGRAGWDVCFPRHSGPWPAWTNTGGIRRYGRFDPVRRTLVEVSPRDDDALPGLAPLLEDGGSLVAYRPGQRAVVRVEGEAGVRYVKVVPPRRARRLIANAHALSRAASTTTAFPSLAQILDQQPDRGSIVFADLPGPSLRDLLLAGSGRTVLPEVGAAIAAFQAATVPQEIEESPAPRLEDWLGFVSSHAPTLAPSYERVLRALPNPPGDHAATIAHGDLHDGNVVLGHSNIGLLDLDGITARHPAEDVGNLLAHLVLRALQRAEGAAVGHDHGDLLLVGYHTAGGAAEREAVMVVVTRTLFRLACVYRFRGRWRTLSPLLLHEAAGLGREVTRR